MSLSKMSNLNSIIEVSAATLHLMNCIVHMDNVIMRLYRRECGYYFRKEQKQMLVDQMMQEGVVNCEEEGFNRIKTGKKHRDQLLFMRKASDEYVDQLTDLEFQGLFRMGKELFTGILETITPVYLSKLSNKGGKLATPVVYVLRATLQF